MELKYAFLCDYAQDSGGKLHAIGIDIDAFFWPDLKQPLPPFFLVVGLSWSISEVGTKTITVRLFDADGRDVLPSINAEVPISKPPPGTGMYTKSRLAIGFANVVFPSYGTYVFSVVVDGREVASLPLTVARPPTSR